MLSQWLNIASLIQSHSFEKSGLCCLENNRIISKLILVTIVIKDAGVNLYINQNTIVTDPRVWSELCTWQYYSLGGEETGPRVGREWRYPRHISIVQGEVLWRAHSEEWGLRQSWRRWGLQQVLSKCYCASLHRLL